MAVAVPQPLVQKAGRKFVDFLSMRVEGSVKVDHKEEVAVAVGENYEVAVKVEIGEGRNVLPCAIGLPEMNPTVTHRKYFSARGLLFPLSRRAQAKDNF